MDRREEVVIVIFAILTVRSSKAWLLIAASDAGEKKRRFFVKAILEPRLSTPQISTGVECLVAVHRRQSLSEGRSIVHLLVNALSTVDTGPNSSLKETDTLGEKEKKLGTSSI